VLAGFAQTAIAALRFMDGSARRNAEWRRLLSLAAYRLSWRGDPRRATPDPRDRVA
jgi:hypothetical protein